MQNPIADVFTWPADDPQLLGGQCKGCGAVTFPVQSRCPRCGIQSMAELPCPAAAPLCLGRPRGSRQASTTREDPTGQSFEPFGVGLVQLDDVVRVESRLTRAIPKSSTSVWRSCSESSRSMSTTTATRS